VAQKGDPLRIAAESRDVLPEPVKSCHQVHEPEVALRTAPCSRLEKPYGKEATLVKQSGFESRSPSRFGSVPTVRGSSLYRNISCRDTFCDSPQYLRANAAIVSRLRHDHINHPTIRRYIVWDTASWNNLLTPTPHPQRTPREMWMSPRTSAPTYEIHILHPEDRVG
jgi:hypothetical protein